MQIRCNFPDISYLSETQKNNFQFLSKMWEVKIKLNQHENHNYNKHKKAILVKPHRLRDILGLSCTFKTR